MKPLSIKTTIIVVMLFFGNLVKGQQLADHQIKKNVTPINNATSSLLKLEPQRFEYNTAAFKIPGLSKGVHYGFASENVQTAVPDLVTTKSFSYPFGKNVYRTATISSVNEKELVPVLVAAIKELHTEVNELKQQVKALQKQ